MKLLIIYGTSEGQTRKIAGFIKTEAEKDGAEVNICDATTGPPGPQGYDAVIIGASMHMHRYQTAVEHYVHRHHDQLNGIPGAFVSVSLSAVGGENDPGYKETEEITTQFLRETGWKPVMVKQVAGALRYTQYDFFKKFAMRMIARASGRDTDTSHDTEYTDWEKLRSFVHEFLKVS